MSSKPKEYKEVLLLVHHRIVSLLWVHVCGEGRRLRDLNSSLRQRDKATRQQEMSNRNYQINFLGLTARLQERERRQ